MKRQYIDLTPWPSGWVKPYNKSDVARWATKRIYDFGVSKCVGVDVVKVRMLKTAEQ